MRPDDVDVTVVAGRPLDERASREVDELLARRGEAIGAEPLGEQKRRLLSSVPPVAERSTSAAHGGSVPHPGGPGDAGRTSSVDGVAASAGGDTGEDGRDGANGQGAGTTHAGIIESGSARRWVALARGVRGTPAGPALLTDPDPGATPGTEAGSEPRAEPGAGAKPGAGAGIPTGPDHVEHPGVASYVGDRFESDAAHELLGIGVMGATGATGPGAASQERVRSLALELAVDPRDPDDAVIVADRLIGALVDVARDLVLDDDAPEGPTSGIGAASGTPDPSGATGAMGSTGTTGATGAPGAPDTTGAPDTRAQDSDPADRHAPVDGTARTGPLLRLWVPDARAEDDELARRHGFRPERDLLQLRCPLPVPASRRRADDSQQGVRAFVPLVDDQAWLTANNRAFAGHPEQGGWDLDRFRSRQREPWFVAAGLLVLDADAVRTPEDSPTQAADSAPGSPAGFAGSCWTKVHRDVDPPMGEIYVIGVDPAFHGMGLGRVLTLAGLDWLAAQGLQVGMLYVDRSNTAAVGLYRSLGFTEHHVDRAYVRALP